MHRRALLAAALATPCILRAQGLPAVVSAGKSDAASAAAASPGISDGAWHDASRSRDIPWRARWPAGTDACPLVLYSHGLGGSREGGDAWGEAWRAAGIAVLHLQHPGSDGEVLRAGLRGLRAAASVEQLAARVHDLRFAMDELARRTAAGQTPWARVRTDALGVAGHSFGAHTTQALAGQRYRVPADFADARPRAFIALSPSAGRGAQPAPETAFGGITRPFLCVTGSLDGDPFGSHDTGEPRLQVFHGLPPGRRALLWLHGADHMTFGGNASRRIRRSALRRRDRQAEQDEPRKHALVASVSASWWRAHLLGERRAHEALAAVPSALGPHDRFEQG